MAGTKMNKTDAIKHFVLDSGFEPGEQIYALDFESDFKDYIVDNNIKVGAYSNDSSNSSIEGGAKYSVKLISQGKIQGVELLNPRDTSSNSIIVISGDDDDDYEDYEEDNDYYDDDYDDSYDDEDDDYYDEDYDLNNRNNNNNRNNRNKNNNRNIRNNSNNSNKKHNENLSNIFKNKTMVVISCLIIVYFFLCSVNESTIDYITTKLFIGAFGSICLLFISDVTFGRVELFARVGLGLMICGTGMACFNVGTPITNILSYSIVCAGVKTCFTKKK